MECNDEISTGLDAARTYDISKILGETTRIRHTVRIVSLLQPSPETVALFDELILLGEGRILYAGPVDEVTRHFKSLGYEQPDRMDPVDWLQVSKNLSCYSVHLCRNESFFPLNSFSFSLFLISLVPQPRML